MPRCGSMDISFQGLADAINRLKSKKVMITMHSIADTDAIASATALQSMLPYAEICTPDILTSNAARVLRKLGFGNVEIKREFVDDADAIILVDVNNFNDCGAFRDKLRANESKVIIIDHHRLNYESNARIFCDEAYNSSASIVFDIANKLGHAIGPKLAKLIAMGIISDSAEFKNASAETFTQLGALFRIGSTDYITLIEETEHFAPAIERQKTINDLFNSTVEVKGDLLFMYGIVHAYANLAADEAIRVGADVALFWGIGREISFSARLRPNIDKRYGIHAGAIMAKLSPLINGTGGGHPAAAGAYGSGLDKADDFKNAFLNEILEKVMGK